MKKLIYLPLLLVCSITFAQKGVQFPDYGQFKLELPQSEKQDDFKFDISAQEKLEQIKEILIDTKPQQVQMILEEMKKNFSNIKMGGSSTGGGSDRTERFKALGHIYSSYLENLTEADRDKYGISVTAQELKEIIVQFGDHVYELDRGHNFNILDFKNEIQAQVKNGVIYETGKKKSAYFARNALFDNNELVIYLSQNWTPKENTIPLKEFLRVLGKQDEIPGILDYLANKEVPDLTLDKNNLKHLNSKIRFNTQAKEETVTIKKNSSCVLIREMQEKLKALDHSENLYTGPFSKAREELKNCATVAAVQYASRICHSEYEQHNKKNQEFRYAKLSKFTLGDSSCKKNSAGQLVCETAWEANCSYWYAN
ncbi:hypothetical protein M899_3345 [Bacteriovorax sp. BSW11_IV]|uniref:hypothetical protein n=1 Tax=Bacteriovorax sp. BSW11_IV TaxID=1353529 RepID=UPI00038A112B|nr:hypothetical protein [Bacteriovorax sp. BSW11_IV]EQC48769.1 hypothetical protein M899_3345 [Bacteriovorax sp. BSW11_IV]